MKIIISPAKKMKVDTDSFDIESLPQFLPQTEELLALLQKMSLSELQEMWQCSDKLAQQAYQQLNQIDLKHQLTPAIIAYSGIQYQYMAPDVFSSDALAYVQDHLRILSGFYGALRPFDGVSPYRLEMQSRLKIAGHQNLYDFWSSRPTQGLQLTSGEPIINLASQEYAKAIRSYVSNNNPIIDINFVHEDKGKLKTRATFAKMARGEMVRFMAENNVHNLDELKQFDHLNYRFEPSLSSKNKFTFFH